MSLDYLNIDLPSNILRRHVLDMARNGNSVHIACAFSMIELFSVIYGKFVRIDLDNLENPERDLVCLSKGHGVMAVYACFFQMGVLDEKHIREYFADGSLLKGLADCHVPGIEVTGGSLGHGVPVSVGLALAIKLRKENRKVFCLAGDGEMNEGSVWESLLFAAHWQLDNFILIIDANEYQAMGKSVEVLNCEPFAAKFAAFNFDVWECDGHSRADLERILTLATAGNSGRPKAVVARTLKGKGVSFMQGDNSWHYTRLNDETYSAATAELASKS